VSANVLRFRLILVLVVAAVISVVANKTNNTFLGWLSFAVFLCAVAIYVAWRRRAMEERRGRVLDSEAKTDEDRSSPDQ
jgi:uncharacterized membrane protein YfcA